MGGISRIADIPKVVERALDGIVFISCSAGDGLSISQGTGFFVDNEHVVTAYHVVKKARSISVMLYNGETYSGELIAYDQSRDLALLKLKGCRSSKPLPLADSNKLRLGQPVLAVGYQFGKMTIDPSVSFGIISRLYVVVEIKVDNTRYVIDDLIQSDAPVNPGNSGGPLIDLKGRVVGVVSGKIFRAEGACLAIPSNTVRRFINMVKTYGKPLHADIGVVVAPLTKFQARRLGIKDSGLKILYVEKGSPAAEAGLQAGDIIAKANGKAVRVPGQLRDIIENSIPRGRVKLEVIRNNRRINITVKIHAKEIGRKTS